MSHNKRHPRRIDQIAPGFYEYRRVKGGPLMPARVEVQDGMVWVTEGDKLTVGIKVADYEDLVVRAIVYGEAFQEPLLRVLWFGEPIDERQHNRLLGILAVARASIPDHPMLFPDRPINVRDVKVDRLF